MSRKLAKRSAVAVLGVLALLVAWAFARPSGGLRERALAQLVRASAGQRFTEGRLSGGFGYAAWTRRPRPPAPEVLLAASKIEASVLAAEQTDAELLHVRGVTWLLLGKIDAAVATLREASAQSPGDAAILNDRAVAHLERAAREGSVLDLIASYELADEALRIDPDSPEATFNRALATGRLGLPVDAATAWKDFLKLDAGSPWVDEATGYLRSLTRPAQQMTWDTEVRHFEAEAAAANTAAVRLIVARYPQQTRIHFEDVMVGAWAKSEAAGDARASERALRALRVVADALRTTTANTIPQRTVATIQAAATPIARASLIRGHLAYANAIALYRQLKFRVSEPELESSQQLLEESGSPFALLALFYRASARSSDHDISGALAMLEKCERGIQAADLAETPLHGHVHWVRGRSLLNRGFPHASLQSFQKALTVFERTGEVESVASVHGLLAWNYEFLGDEERAWWHYVKALHILDGGHPRRERVILHDIADYATNCGRSRLALLYASAFVRLVQAGGEANDVAGALIERSRAWKAVGQAERSQEDLQQARRLERRVADPGLRAYLQASLAVAEAEVMGAKSAGETFAAFDRAVELIQRVELKTVLPRVLIERAQAARDLRRDDEAERSLREAISLIEEQRSSVADRDLQIGFAEEWYRAFDAMVEMLAGQGRAVEALAFAERSRARTLLEQTTPAAGRDRNRSLKEITAQIPDGAGVVVYALLEHSSVIWIVRRDSLVSERIPATRFDIAALVAQWEAARGKEHDERRALGALHDAVVRPIAMHVRNGERLIFVPDKALQAVPFAALYDGARRRWLVEDHTIGIVPSLAMFVTSLARDRDMRRFGRDRLLAVGDPEFDPEQFPRFSRLPFAAVEAREIASEYVQAETLLGSDATREQILERAKGTPVIHLAAHAAINPVHPSHSALLLAPDRNSPHSGALYAFELDRKMFLSTRLLVLAACSTAGSRASDYEGPLGLARGFLSTGVPTVVATLWDIDDAVSRDLLLSFHRRLRAGDDAQTALRKTQLRMIAHSDPTRRRVSAWAGFQAVGGFFEN